MIRRVSGFRKAQAANDAAVLKAYGWPTDLSEPEIVSRLFDMYAAGILLESGQGHQHFVV